MRQMIVKPLAVMSFLLVMLLTVGCSESKLKVIVALANKECPIDVEGVGKVTSITYEDNTIYYNCKVTSPDVDITTLRSLTSLLKTEIINTLVTDDDRDVKELIKLVKDADTDIVYRFTDRSERLDIVITSIDLKNATSTGGASTDNLDDMITVINLNTAEDDITCHKEGQSLVLVIPLGPEDKTLKEISADKAAIKENLMEAIAPDADPLYDLCVEHGLDLVYRYRDSEENSVDIRITTQEIRERL